MNATSAEQAVWAAVEAFNKAFSDNDAARYFTLMDDELTLFTPANPYRVEGIDDDREGFEAGIRAGYARVEYFHELQPRIQVFGDVAIVTYHSRGRYGVDAQAKTLYYKETDILIRRDEQWKVVHIHVSATA